MERELSSVLTDRQGINAAMEATGQLDSVSSSAFRACMRNHAGAVAVVAVGSPGKRTGLTATAVCALSDNPATILVCVNQSASAHGQIAQDRAFSINLLTTEQVALAECFSGRQGLAGEERFRSGTWRTEITGAPVLEDAFASLDCSLHERFELSTHSIFVGLVRHVQVRKVDGSRPLIYLQGAFSTAAPL